MEKAAALNVVKRFVALALEKRKAYYRKMSDEGFSLGDLPIPVLWNSDMSPPALSHAQERQWFLWHMDPQSTAYHITSALRLRGALEITALQRCFEALIQRHACLRTRFTYDDDTLVQTIVAEMPWVLQSHTDEPGSEPEAERIHSFIDAQNAMPFDLQTGPLLRAALLRVAVDDHVLVLVQHHIISDGVSMQIMVDELVQLYAGYSQGREVELDPLPIQYVDYAIWQRHWMEAGEKQRQLDYWTRQLGAEPPVLALPHDFPRPQVFSYRGSRIDLDLAPELAHALNRLAATQGVTLFMLLLASFQVLLHRYSGQSVINVGVPIANRSRHETKGLVGFFVNTQVLKGDVDGLVPFNEFLREVKRCALEAQTFQDLPFEHLVEALQPERSLSHNPLFQVMFSHQVAQPQAAGQLDLAGLTIEPVNIATQSAQFDLTLDVFESSTGLSAGLTYAQDLFEASTIERMGEHWINLLQGIVADPGQRIADLPLLSLQERDRTLQTWNATAVDYPQAACIHSLIEAQVRRTPDAVALTFAARHLSYGELNAQSNRLAHRLIEAGVGPDVRVGIAMQRSLEMVVGLLAILKAGGAYVPLDPEYPQERLSYMIQDSGIGLLLSAPDVLERLPSLEGVEVLRLDGDDQWLAGYRESDPDVSMSAGNLAYVIYTSGSTGRPKGVGNEHRGLVNRLLWMQAAYGLDERDAVMQKTPFSFDVSVWEFFWPLLTGSRLVIAAPGAHREPQALIELIVAEGVTTLHFVPSMLQAFVQGSGLERCQSLKRIVCSGEALPVQAQLQVFARLPWAGLYNLYGPTEAAIDVTHWHCVDERRDAVPIGRPIDNMGCQILDAGLEPVVAGVQAELYLQGVGLARGYVGRASLTAERFVPNPYVSGERMYRTGDLASQRHDGVIEYAGRIDHQVKLRGLRIELGEIEARLLECPGVREAVVLVHDQKALIGYVSSDDQASGWRERLDEALARGLPGYMVPNRWIAVQEMPVTGNGKLDRKALLALAAHSSVGYQAPQTELEGRIASIWADVLRIEKVGANDNFFELGGDSISSIQVVNRARQAGIYFTPKELFQRQTVSLLARVAQTEQAVAADQAEVRGHTPLLPFQHWFLQADIADNHHWNQSVLLQPMEPVDASALEQALRTLMIHHDALRLSFPAENATCATHRSLVDQHHLWDEHPVLWHATVQPGEELTRFAEQVQRSLDLRNGPLLRAALIDLTDGGQRLLLVIHHLVVDGMSWRILLEDLQTAYEQARALLPLVLPAKTSALKHCAQHLVSRAAEPGLQAQVHFWEALLTDQSVTLPALNPNGPGLNSEAASVVTRLSREFTRRLLQQAPAAYRTQINDLLLTALARVVTRWTGHDSALVQLEGHGREDLFDELELTRTVGWFTSLFPVRLTPSIDIGRSIKTIKEQLRSIPDKGMGFGVLRYLGGQAVQQRLSALPIPRITFNYLGQLDAFNDPQAAFIPAPDNAGSEQSHEASLPNWLCINGQVYDGQLSLSWTFSTEVFDSAVIGRLADEYASQLQALIEHCCDARHHGVTPSDFPLANLSQAQLDELPVQSPLIEDLYPLSPMQEGMLFHTLYGQGDAHYVNQTRVRITGLDVDRFRSSWQSVLARHDILRSSFVWGSGYEQPVQLVHRSVELPFRVIDWRDRPLDEQALEDWLLKDREQGFDLTQAPLLRLTLIQVADDQHDLIYTHHHILMDGWSTSQLFGEVLQHYTGHAVQRAVGRYRDHITWLQKQDKAVSEAFWKEQLIHFQAPTRLAHAIRPAQPRHIGHRQHVQVMSEDRTRRLSEFARAQKVTVNTLVQAAWLLLLQRYTGHETVAFGATVAGRPAGIEGIEQQIGLFINTLAVIASPRPEMKVGEWLQVVQNQNLALREQEHTPLYEVQRWAGSGGEALFDSILVFENFPVSQVLERGAPEGLTFGAVETREQTNYPLTIALTLEECLSFTYGYACESFDPQTIVMLSEHMLRLLEGLSHDAQAGLGTLNMLEAGQQQVLTDDWNRPEKIYPTHHHLVELIEAQVHRSPDAVALVFGEQSLSYGLLNQRANTLAHRLINQGVGPEVRVGIAARRGFEMVVGLLAILKAGGAYVPLDPEYPRDRLAHMVHDSGIALLVAEEAVLDRLPQHANVQILLLEADPTDGCKDDPRVSLSPGNLAYVIYTSGSTGLPKGVAVEHGAIAMHCLATADWYEMTAADRELHFLSFAFDGGHERWLTTLVCGGSLLLRSDELWTPQRTYEEIRRHGVTMAGFPPLYLQQLADHAEQVGNPPPVRLYSYGGDAMPQASFAKIQSALQPRLMINGYGPTEAVVTPLVWKTRRTDVCQSAYAPIGRCVGARQAYVLAEDLSLNPMSIPGELFIGGPGLARGYLGKASLTAERFVPDPYSDGGRLYRTADLVRNGGGAIDYLGRLDNQVKIRGFRIELGEVEACLMQQAGVHDAVVIARDVDGLGKQLVGYVLPAAQQAPTSLCADLNTSLREQLPAYMVPGHLVCLAQWPLTPGGKLDRNALPTPDRALLRTQDYIAPQSALEQRIADLWAQVLKVDAVGLQDNFFELGGHSLLATQVTARLQLELSAQIAIAPLFESKTLKEYAAIVQHSIHQNDEDFDSLRDILTQLEEV